MAEKIVSTSKSVLWAYIGTIVSMSSNFLILPLNFIFLSSAEIGYWYILLSISSLVTLFDFGFDPTFARNIAYVWSGARGLKTKGAEQVVGEDNTDFKLFGQILSVARVVYLLISSFVTLFLVSAGSIYVKNVVFNQLSGTKYWIGWIIFCASMFVNMYFGYMSALLRGTGKIVGVNKAIVFSRVIQIVLTLILFLFGLGIISPIVGLFCYGILFRFFCRKYFYSDIVVIKNRASINGKIKIDDLKKILQSIWPNTWRDGLVGLSNYLTTQGTSLIAASFLPLGLVGTYSIGVQFANAIASGASALNSAIHPVLQSDYIRGDFKGMRVIVSRTVVTYVLLSCFGFFGVFFVAFPVLTLFKSTTMPGFFMFFLLWTYYFIFQFQSTHASFIADMNEVPYVRAFLITSLIYTVQLPLILWVSNSNVYLMIMSSILAQSVYNLWKWPLTLYSKIDTNILQVMREGFIQLKTDLIKTKKRRSK